MIREDKKSKEEINDKIKLFLKNNIYAFLKIKSEEFYRIYNGFITENNKDSFLFNDDVLGIIPIMKIEIIKIEVSNRTRSEPPKRRAIGDKNG